MPHLQKPKEVHVSADASTNTLIIEAPTERRASFEALVEQLDRVQLPPTAQLRTYHIERGDPNDIARTINELARRGVMSLQPKDGSKPVEVIVQAEPKSRMHAQPWCLPQAMASGCDPSRTPCRSRSYRSSAAR